MKKALGHFFRHSENGFMEPEAIFQEDRYNNPYQQATVVPVK